MNVSLTLLFVLAGVVARSVAKANEWLHYARPLLPPPHDSCSRVADQHAQFVYIRKLEKQL